MPIPNLVQTTALLAGTALTAAGLNLGVLALNDPDQETAAAGAPVEQPDPNETVDLVALSAPAEAPAASVQETPPVEEASQDTLAAVTTAEAVEVEDSDDEPEYEDESDDDSRDDDSDDERTSRTATSQEPVTSQEPATTQVPTTKPAPPSTDAVTSRPPTTVAPTSAVPTTAAPAPAPPAPVTVYPTFEFEGIATIIIAVHDGKSLEFWSAITEDDWAFMVEKDLGTKVKLKFRPTNGGDEAEFEAVLVNGEVKIKREY